MKTLLTSIQVSWIKSQSFYKCKLFFIAVCIIKSLAVLAMIIIEVLIEVKVDVYAKTCMVKILLPCFSEFFFIS